MEYTLGGAYQAAVRGSPQAWDFLSKAAMGGSEDAVLAIQLLEFRGDRPKAELPLVRDRKATKGQSVLDRSGRV